MHILYGGLPYVYEGFGLEAPPVQNPSYEWPNKSGTKLRSSILFSVYVTRANCFVVLRTNVIATSFQFCLEFECGSEGPESKWMIKRYLQSSLKKMRKLLSAGWVGRVSVPLKAF